MTVVSTSLHLAPTAILAYEDTEYCLSVFVSFSYIAPQLCHLQEKSSYRNFALVNHNTICTHHPVAISSQGGQENLNSGLGFVHIDCQLVSCCLPVSSDGTSEDDQIRSFVLAKEFVLIKQSGSIHASAPVNTISYDKND